MEELEYRKIIEFGKSSYVVSLPKPWLNENNLGKGSVLYVRRQGNDVILMPSENSDQRTERKCTLDVTGMKKEAIKRQLVARYIRNFDHIILKADDLENKSKDVRALIHDLMALEILEENSTKIVTKCFLNMREIDPFELITRMDLITKEMFRDSQDCFVEDKYPNISGRDTDVNRIAYLVFRKLRSYEFDPVAFRKSGFGNDLSLTMWIVTLKVEHIADDVKRIAKLMRRLKFKKSEQERFLKLYSDVFDYYEDAMKLFFTKDAKKAAIMLANKKKYIKQCRDFYRENWNHEWVPVILEKMKSIVAEVSEILTYVGNLDE